MNNTKILIADENQGSRSALREELRSLGYVNVFEASDGEEALSVIDNILPDVVLIDVLLSKLDGIGVVRQVKKAMGGDLEPELAEYVNTQIEARKAAKRAKNYAEADRIRDELKEKGIMIEDTPQGVRIIRL